MHLLLDLHNLNWTDNKRPDSPGHDTIPGNLQSGEVAKVPAHDAVHTESDSVGESNGTERSVESTVEPQKLTLKQYKTLYPGKPHPFLPGHPAYALES